MLEKRIRVWVQQFQDRDSLMLQWIDPDSGKRKSKSSGTADENEAEDARADLESDLNNGRHKEASRMTWAKFRELFEAEYVSGLRRATRDNYGDTFRAFERLAHPASLRAVSERTFSTFVGALRREPGIGGMLQESTIKLRLEHLRTAFRWAAKQKIIASCPDFPSIRPPKRKPQPVPTETVDRLLAKAPDASMRAFMLAGWLAGLRLNEALGLEWETTETAPYLDLAGERIVFPAGIVKAVEDQWTPLDRQLREELLALPRHGPKVFRFVEAQSGKPVKDIAVSHRVVKVARQAGVKLTMKSLRRGFGCYWASRVPAQVLQKLMRHSSIAITMTYYANVDEPAMQAILSRERNTYCNTTPTAGKETTEGAAGGTVTS